MSMRIITILLLLLFNLFSVDAGNSQQKVRFDTLTFNYKPVPIEKVNYYKQYSDFRYVTDQPIIPGFWHSLLYKIKQIIIHFFSGLSSGPVVDTLLIIFITATIIVFVLLLLSLFGVDVQSLYIRNKRYPVQHDLIINENVFNQDLDQMVMEEIQAKNYNLAVRYLYLKLLKILTDHHLITWQRDKTNHDYLFELASTSYINEFKMITLEYEYLWYGKFQCNHSDFTGIYDQFKKLYKILNA